MRFYNTFSKSVEAFEPLEAGRVRMYNCGLTVYDYPQIGNARAYTFADILRRSLEFVGYEVTQVINITDVGHLTQDEIEAGEDKMQAAAKREKVDIWKIADKFIAEWYKLVGALNFRRAAHYPRATDHIAEMIAMIETLVAKKHAYVVNGNLYFDVATFADYGKLSGNTLDELVAGKRVEVNPEKRHPADFALWKVDPDHLMQWDSPWGRGYPGWHIECSAMSKKYLGETFDIHTGGEDNIFPHHECEIAQSVCANGKPFVRYWLHPRFLLVNGRKMSKRDGTFVRLDDVFAKGYDAATLRYALLRTHYRQPMNFTWEGMDDAKTALGRIFDFHRRVHEPMPEKAVDVASTVDGARAKFRAAIEDDLNLSAALGVLFDFMRDANRLLDATPSAPAAKAFAGALDDWNRVLGLLEMRKAETVDADIERKIQARIDARKRKDFVEADRLRKELEAEGIELQDGPGGTKWKRLR